jgi:hypothetical protein
MAAAATREFAVDLRSFFPGHSIDHFDSSSQMALLYLGQKRELIISLSRAHDLVPRPDGSMRNPYVKLFLLPDRSERSRRQSKVLSGTLNPVWDEHFFYEELDERNLRGRVLEVSGSGSQLSHQSIKSIN